MIKVTFLILHHFPVVLLPSRCVSPSCPVPSPVVVSLDHPGGNICTESLGKVQAICLKESETTGPQVRTSLGPGRAKFNCKHGACQIHQQFHRRLVIVLLYCNVVI